ncbi:hypothetical protein [Hydrogenophaga sp.]|uniref:hypothetical protein n=1 Tax=Hydrogenophaga sp. TaxID=1904254 RepID=UPI002BF34A5B|nr:hypothetical protein [Hydrogenophaga sp.]HMP11179.1 hypothetical protein [Hydrogenophaga sp.]
MTINTTPKKKMPTEEANSTAGDTINDREFSTEYEALRAAYAMRGHTLRRTDPADGPVTYWAERWGLVRHLPTLHDVGMFLSRIGGRV